RTLAERKPAGLRAGARRGRVTARRAWRAGRPGGALSSIRRWPDARGLGRYADACEANDVDLDALGELTDADLVEIRVSLGHRRLILRAIREERAAAPAPAAGPAPRPARLPAHLARRILSDRPRLEGERRQLTVLFADVVGFTALSELLDPE